MPYTFLWFRYSEPFIGPRRALGYALVGGTPESSELTPSSETGSCSCQEGNSTPIVRMLFTRARNVWRSSGFLQSALKCPLILSFPSSISINRCGACGGAQTLKTTPAKTSKKRPATSPNKSRKKKAKADTDAADPTTPTSTHT